MPVTPWADELALAARLAREAGAISMKHRAAGVTAVEKPGGEGPVTAADRECDAFIRGELARRFPGDGLLTEETPDDGAWRQQARTWMVDPIDGTKEFVRGGDEFASMVGLCVDGVPTVGAVYKPVGDVLFTAARGVGAWRESAGARTVMKVARGVTEPLVVAVSRSHRTDRLDKILAALGPIRELTSGSVGLKIGLIATGDASAYINASRQTCLWDTCAPAIILQEAGGALGDLAGQPLSWSAGLQHPGGIFSATADVHAHLLPRVVTAARLVANMLSELPDYPREAFVLPG